MIAAGKIIEYLDNGKFICGFVTEIQPKRVHLFNHNKREVKLPISRVIHCSNCSHATDTNKDLVVKMLQDTNEKRNSLMTEIDLENTAGSKPGSYVALTVSDTGTGIEKEFVDRIFDPYFTTKEEGKGTGLGLATVYSIVHACKGDIRVKSTPGKGTVFTIMMPVAATQIPEDLAGKNHTHVEPGMGKRILVVDDDQEIAEMCRDGFESIGYKVDKFFSSVEALDFFRKNQK